MAAPTIQVFTDTFSNRAITPTGATTGSYGPPNSSWGLGNGWYDLVGSSGAVPGTGWNITSAGANCTILSKFGTLVQDPALTATPNQSIIATFTSILTANNATYYVLCRGTYNTDCYAAVLNSSSFAINRLSGGNNTINTVTTASVTPASGHTYSIQITATGDGATTTTLTAVCKDITAGTTLSTLNGTDTTLELQSGGRVGMGVYATAAQAMNITTATIYSDTALAYTTKYLGFIGDSLTYGLSTTLQTVPDLMCRILNSLSLSTRYIPINMGFSGATTANWLNGASTGYMAAFIKNAQALGCTTVFITLGSNDALQSVTAATWLSNMQSIINYIASQIGGVQMYFNFPPYFDWVRFSNAYSTGTAASLPLLRTYNFAALTGITIGDTIANSTFQYLNYQGLYDGGHPSDQGVPELMFLWLFAYMKNSNMIGPASTSTITF